MPFLVHRKHHQMATFAPTAQLVPMFLKMVSATLAVLMSLVRTADRQIRGVVALGNVPGIEGSANAELSQANNAPCCIFVQQGARSDHHDMIDCPRN